MSRPLVAIVGRPNVGKSTLFNRLVGFRKAMVHDRPGVTRDRLYEEAELLDYHVLLVDTGGLEARPDTDLLTAMRRQSLIAVEEAEVIVFVVDGKAGFVPADAEVAELLRRSNKPVVLAVNKVDGPVHEDLAAEFWQVGIDPLVTISAEHGRNMYELLDAIVRFLPESALVKDDDAADSDTNVAVVDPDAEGEYLGELVDVDAAPGLHQPWSGSIRIAVVGRPNIGKSTLINAMLGEDRHLVHDSPGTTTDPVDSTVHGGERDYVFVDTAGVRRKSRIDDPLERWVSLRSIRAIERCHVTLLMIDGTVGPTDQDAKLAQLVIDRGRALIVLINKWDLVKDLEEIDAESIADGMARKLPHTEFAPYMFISARTGKGVHRILPAIERVFKQFDSRISTSRLNKFLEVALAQHSPPQVHHHPVRINYATQSRVRPPTFVFFSNTPEGIPESYRRYLQNQLREVFDLEGTPVRLMFRKKRKPGEE